MNREEAARLVDELIEYTREVAAAHEWGSSPCGFDVRREATRQRLIDELCPHQEIDAALLAACKFASAAPAKAVAIMKREGFLIDNPSDHWQKLAFTFYSDLVEIATRADGAIAGVEGRE